MSSGGRSRAPSRWTGLSPEQRQRERRQLLIDAAFDLLATEGSNGTTVRAVCSRARLNPRYFYESFDDLDALIVAVYDQVVFELGTRISQAAAGLASEDEDAAMRTAVAETVTFVAEDRRRGHVLYIAALDNEALNRRRQQTGAALMELVQKEPSRWRGPGTDAEVGKLAAAVVVGGFNELLTAWLEDRITLAPAELAEDAATVFLAVRDSMRGIGATRAV